MKTEEKLARELGFGWDEQRKHIQFPETFWLGDYGKQAEIRNHLEYAFSKLWRKCLELREQRERGGGSAKEWLRAYMKEHFDELLEYGLNSNTVSFRESPVIQMLEAYASSRLAEVSAQLQSAVEFGYKQCEQGHNLGHALAEFKRVAAEEDNQQLIYWTPEALRERATREKKER